MNYKKLVTPDNKKQAQNWEMSSVYRIPRDKQRFYKYKNAILVWIQIKLNSKGERGRLRNAWLGKPGGGVAERGDALPIKAGPWRELQARGFQEYTVLSELNREERWLDFMTASLNYCDHSICTSPRCYRRGKHRNSIHCRTLQICSVAERG